MKTSRTGLMPAVTQSSSLNKDRDGKPMVKKVSSATLARRARSPSPAQTTRGVKPIRREDSIGARQKREITHKGYQRNTLLQPTRNSVKPTVAIPTAMMSNRHRDVNNMAARTSYQPVETNQRDVHFENQNDEESDKDLFDIDNISANTSEVRDLIKMYKVLLGGGESDDKDVDKESDEDDIDIQPAALSPEAIGSMSLRQLASDNQHQSHSINNIEEHLTIDPSSLELPPPHTQTIEEIFEDQNVDRKQSIPSQTRKTRQNHQNTAPKVYTDYHRQMERVEKELKESAAERAILTAQNASLESKCLGLESELEAMRKQHVELHLSTQTTNEKLITSVQGILTSMNDLSDRVRNIESRQQVVPPTAPAPAPEAPIPRSEVADIIHNYASVHPVEANLAAASDHIPLGKKITVINEPASLNIDSFDHRSTARCLNLGSDLQPVSLTPASNLNSMYGNSAQQSPGASPDESVGSGSTSPSPYSIRNEVRKLHETYSAHAVHVGH